MPYGGRCRRNRKEQLSAPGFWLAVSCRRITSSLRSAVSTDCTRARSDQSASSTALSLDRLGFIRLRRRQRFWRHALDLTMPIRVDDDAREHDLRANAAVRFSVGGELGRENLA